MGEKLQCQVEVWLCLFASYEKLRLWLEAVALQVARLKEKGAARQYGSVTAWCARNQHYLFAYWPTFSAKHSTCACEVTR